ncbi:MAG: 4a-hydroxytetrahydrobiopterin dehydratase [Marinibacterium sp.]|nr:4a-hydroxytetrahydrobiopterin dehydratase [Marinibacterium sp.]
MRKPLTETDRQETLATLLASGWVVCDNRDAIQKQFIFENFTVAFQWMTGVAIEAEKLGHHPEWSNVYRTVDVVLTTHDIGGLSELDVALATRMDAMA